MTTLSKMRALKHRFGVVDAIPLGYGETFTTCLSCGERGFHESCVGHQHDGKLLFIGSVCSTCLTYGGAKDVEDEQAED